MIQGEALMEHLKGQMITITSFMMGGRWSRSCCLATWENPTMFSLFSRQLNRILWIFEYLLRKMTRHLPTHSAHHCKQLWLSNSKELAGLHKRAPSSPNFLQLVHIHIRIVYLISIFTRSTNNNYSIHSIWEFYRLVLPSLSRVFLFGLTCDFSLSSIT